MFERLKHFQQSSSNYSKTLRHLKILGARKVTGSNYYPEESRHRLSSPGDLLSCTSSPLL